MSTYTVIWEYRRGTYMKQVRARTPRGALLAWSRALSPGEIPGLGEKRLARFVQALAEDHAETCKPVAIHGLTNAWCAGTPYDSNGDLLSIVKTDLSD